MLQRRNYFRSKMWLEALSETRADIAEMQGALADASEATFSSLLQRDKWLVAQRCIASYNLDWQKTIKWFGVLFWLLGIPMAMALIVVIARFRLNAFWVAIPLIACLSLASATATIGVRRTYRIVVILCVPVTWASITFTLSNISPREFLIPRDNFITWRGLDTIGLRGLIVSAAIAALITSYATVVIRPSLLLARRITKPNQMAIAICRSLQAITTCLDTTEWRSISGRHYLVGAIDDTAQSIHAVLRSFELDSDAVNATWAHRQANAIKGSVLNLKRWVLTPGPETQMDLARRLCHISHSLITLEFDGILTSDGFDTPIRISWKARMLRVARQVGAAVLPLGVVALLVYVNVIPNEGAGAALAGGGAFTLLAILRMLDSQSATGIGEAHQMTALLFDSKNK